MAINSESSPNLLTVRQVAMRLGIGLRTISSLTASGDLPCVRIGRSVRYDPADVAAFVERLKAQTGRAPRRS